MQWTSNRFANTELLNHIVKRINEASGIYQMFGQLGDVIVFNRFVKSKSTETILNKNEGILTTVPHQVA